MTLEDPAPADLHRRLGLQSWALLSATAHPKERHRQQDDCEPYSVKTLTSYLAGKGNLDDVPRFPRAVNQTGICPDTLGKALY